MNRFIALAAATLFLAAPASAHDMPAGAHGGQIVDVKGHHVEFTSKDTSVTIYLTDDKDAPLSSAGTSAKAIVQDSGKTVSVALTPAEPNVLTGKLDSALAPGAKIVVSGKLADGHDILARFVAK